jgi:hypothetical protein
MFRLKRAQWDAFERAEVETFEDEMVEHLRRHFPTECQQMGDESLREFIAEGLERAERVGIITERSVCKYLNVAMCFGADFTTREPWAISILKDDTITDPDARADTLANAGVEVLEQRERGENGEARHAQ